MKRRPDRLYQIEIEDMELTISPEYDIMHKFKKLGFSILRYWEEESGMSDVLFAQELADKVIKFAGLHVIKRDYITNHEIELWERWQQAQGEYTDEYIAFMSQDLDEIDIKSLRDDTM